jgi:hypothetical protein
MEKDPVTRTLRIEYDYDEALREDSEKQGISVNNLSNQILKKYTEYDRYFGRGQSITLSPRTLESLINNIEDIKIMEIGRQMGSQIPKDRLLMRGSLINRESVLWFIESVLGGYSDWFTSNIHETQDSTIFYLRHVYNKKWSMFIENYLSSMFEELLQIDNIKIETTGLTLSFKLTK